MSGEKRSIGDQLKHAFAVDPPGPTEMDDDEREIIDKVCHAIIKRGLVTPTAMFLEMTRPMNYLGSQVMHVFQPILATVIHTGGYKTFAQFLERRGSIETLCRRLEELDVEHRRALEEPDENEGDALDAEPPTPTSGSSESQ